METWLGLVVFAALFFLMMKFGRGSHMAHGDGKKAAHSGPGGGCCGGGMEAHMAHGKAGDDGAAAQEGGRDPVCGMQKPETRDRGEIGKDELDARKRDLG